MSMSDDLPSVPAPETLAADAARAWTALTGQAKTPQQRACLATATAVTDRLWVLVHDGSLAGAVDVIPPRDGQWCRLALSTYDHLLSASAYAQLAHARPYTCAAVDTAIDAWLRSTADAAPGDAPAATVAEHLGITDSTATEPGRWLSTVVNAAQDARVFGVANHRIDILLGPGADATRTVRVLVEPPHGPVLASPPVSLADLAGPHTAGIGSAVAALTGLGPVVDELFTAQQSATWHHPPPHPDADEQRPGPGFPKLHEVAAAAPPRIDPDQPSRSKPSRASR
jgi:hypothetical protein